MLSSGSVTGCGRWYCRKRWCRFGSRLWSQLSASVGGGTSVPLGLQHVCRFYTVPFWQERHPAVWFWQSLSLVAFFCRVQLLMPRKLNTPHLLFSDFSTKFLDQILHFIYYVTQRPFFGHFGHIHVRGFPWAAIMVLALVFWIHVMELLLV